MTYTECSTCRAIVLLKSYETKENKKQIKFKINSTIFVGLTKLATLHTSNRKLIPCYNQQRTTKVTDFSDTLISVEWGKKCVYLSVHKTSEIKFINIKSRERGDLCLPFTTTNPARALRKGYGY